MAQRTDLIKRIRLDLTREGRWEVFFFEYDPTQPISVIDINRAKRAISAGFRQHRLLLQQKARVKKAEERSNAV